MNNNILKKCLTELSNENPKLDYMRGMLETLIALDEKPGEIEGKHWTKVVLDTQEKVEVPQDEASLLDAKARAALETIKALNTEA